jgi:hypothetical protein
MTPAPAIHAQHLAWLLACGLGSVALGVGGAPRSGSTPSSAVTDGACIVGTSRASASTPTPSGGRTCGPSCSRR